MPQAVALWNNDLLGCPLADGYSMTQETLVQEATPIEGATRFRRRQEEGLLTLELQVPQTATQYEQFRRFFYLDLNAGRDWFQMPLLFGLETRNLICNMGGVFKQERNQNLHAGFLVSFTVEAYRRQNTAYATPEADFITGGTPELPSPEADRIEGGTPAAPAPDTDIIWGGADLGLPSPV